MTSPLLPDRDKLQICFAHAAYQLGDEFSARNTGMRHFEVRDLGELQARIGEADVLVVSGLWRNELLERAGRLRFIQSVSAGTDQYARDLLRAKGVRLASAQGANERAVAEHAIALILALERQLPQARDNQASRTWRGMIANRSRREDELGGKTLVIVGLGRIGSRVAMLARAFGMRVIGIRRSAGAAPDAVDAVVGPDRLLEVLPDADFVALTCPLTPETEGLIGAPQLSAMKRSAYLINVARGRVVDEAAMLSALQDGRIAGAGLDCFHDEPLPTSSPFWGFANVLITPHTAGETRRYESNVVDLLLDNLERLFSGNPALRNEIV
ncbi:MAG TPA: D-2-hydroxyacid dehydrogenase [Beijerinckiaceae bacterium]|nr:D-2-hydroxyacid dehydrogenase [Beijerinckiaceae bacterium]